MRWNTYIARKILASGGYGMLYNWFCTQQQPAVEYGYLYNWYAATDSRNICSAGFHLPTSTEIATLRIYLSPNPSLKLKETGITHWNSPNAGATNKSGFNGRGSGERIFNTGSFSNIKSYLYLWESTGTCNYSRIDYNSGDFIAYSSSTLGRTKGLSIRPIKDSTTLTEGQTGFYVDPGGIIYPTICIGSPGNEQEWVACNIMTKHYRNGDAIPEVTDNTAWAALTTGARCSYNNLESNAGSTKKLSSSDSFIVAPTQIYESLLNYVDTYDSENNYWPVAGGKLRKTGFTHWNSPNINATDEYGFSLVGSGIRDSYGFQMLRLITRIFTSDGYGDSGDVLYADNDEELAELGPMPMTNGGSIRLCNPTTLNTEGSVNSYTQNDGTIIPTIVINGVEWTMNLKETKWSDGTDISNVTDNTAWSLLQSAACCDINNDQTNR